MYLTLKFVTYIQKSVNIQKKGNFQILILGCELKLKCENFGSTMFEGI